MTHQNQETAATPPGRIPRKVLAMLALVAVSAGIVGAVAGYVLRGRQSTVTMRVGSPYSTPLQIGMKTADGWFYDVPLNVRWRDATGGWQEGARPACLPPNGDLPPVKFASVDVSGGGLSWRQVVWVDCHA